MKELIILLTAMLPGTELRLSIPLAFAVGLSPVEAFCYSVVGNMVPIFLLPLFLDKSTNGLKRFYVFNKMITWLFAWIEKHSGVIAKYGPAGLLLFVAIPMPGMGGWSGCIAAFLMGMPYKTTIMAITAGMLIAAGAVTLACLGIIEFLCLF